MTETSCDKRGHIMSPVSPRCVVCGVFSSQMMLVTREVHESLTARLAAAEAALQPFAKVAADIDPKLEDYMAHHYDHFVGHYRAAAEAAKGGRDE